MVPILQSGLTLKESLLFFKKSQSQLKNLFFIDLIYNLKKNRDSRRDSRRDRDRDRD